MLNDHELLRYSRHILLPQIDIEGQEKLKHAHIVVIGCGGLGNIALPILAGSGIGTLTIVDFDTVELSNLHRQTSYGMNDIDNDKTASMAKKIKNLNPHVKLNIVNKRVDLNDLMGLCDHADCILDCTDNFETRTLINKAALQTQTPLISGSAIRFEGQLSIYDFRDEASPCYACLFTGESASDGDCALFGVFSPVVHIIGATQAQEALKLILNIKPIRTNELRVYSALTSEWQTFGFSRNPQCTLHHSKL